MIGHAASLIRLTEGQTQVRMTRDTGETRIERYVGKRAVLGRALLDVRGRDTETWANEWRDEIVAALVYGRSTLHSFEGASQEQLKYAYDILTALLAWKERNNG